MTYFYLILVLILFMAVGALLNNIYMGYGFRSYTIHLKYGFKFKVTKEKAYAVITRMYNNKYDDDFFAAHGEYIYYKDVLKVTKGRKVITERITPKEINKVNEAFKNLAEQLSGKYKEGQK